ncbi:uncharacterized protein LOC120497101 [Passer montanus]|uniref:uncharacterized protein LOC120497101 n=1 Tax=Passer montanus TaxID=9160 RepID=UPI001960C46B|nr:uncharacterized protein LOC120497101 [Passer montanus]
MSRAVQTMTAPQQDKKLLFRNWESPAAPTTTARPPQAAMLSAAPSRPGRKWPRPLWRGRSLSRSACSGRGRRLSPGQGFGVPGDPPSLRPPGASRRRQRPPPSGLRRCSRLGAEKGVSTVPTWPSLGHWHSCPAAGCVLERAGTGSVRHRKLLAASLRNPPSKSSWPHKTNTHWHSHNHDTLGVESILMDLGAALFPLSYCEP